MQGCNCCLHRRCKALANSRLESPTKSIRQHSTSETIRDSCKIRSARLKGYWCRLDEIPPETAVTGPAWKDLAAAADLSYLRTEIPVAIEQALDGIQRIAQITPTAMKRVFTPRYPHQTIGRPPVESSREFGDRLSK